MMKPPQLRSEAESEHGVRVTWFELFYDLVVVASVSYGSHLFGEHPSWGMGWWLAASLLMLMTFWLLTVVGYNLFPHDGAVRRLLVVVQMVALVIASLSLGRGDEGLPDAVGFAALSAAFASIATVYWFYGRRSATAERAGRVIAPWALLAAVVALVGVVVPSNGQLLANPITWLFAASLLCGFAPLVFVVLNHRTTSAQINAEHLSERMGQLVLIVLGESFVSLVFSLSGKSSIPNPWYFLLDFAVVFSIWTLYFTQIVPAGVPLTVGRLRAWLGLHVVLIFGAIAAAGGFAALTLVPFRAEATAQGFWTPLPLFYVMAALLGISLLLEQSPRIRRIHVLVTVILAVLSAVAIWVIPDAARWLTLAAAACVITDAGVSSAMGRRQARNDGSS